MTTLKNSIKIHSGQFGENKNSLFSIMKDEMFFIEAFISYYRSIGITQFVIFDDKSTDGTREYLEQQPDCVVLESQTSFGQPVSVQMENGESKMQRAGIHLKTLIPEMFFEHAYLLYVDADEFLILPPGVKTIDEVIERLSSAGEACIAASVVEFFPENISQLDSAGKPSTFEDLITDYPFFEAEKVLQLRDGGFPERIGRSKSRHLFKKFKIKNIPSRWEWLPFGFSKYLPFSSGGSPRCKTPILFRSKDTYMVGSHDANVPPTDKALLTIAHFVFTARSKEKIRNAQIWRSHAKSGQKYDHYAHLFREMEKRGGSFMGKNTTRYETPEQFVVSGLMKW